MNPRLLRRRAAATTAVALLALTFLYASPAAAVPTRYEAENATISQGTVATNHLGYSGTGFVDMTNVTGSYVEWTISAAAAGTATLGIRFANGTTTDRPMDIAVNGTVTAANLSFPSTGNWDTWQTKTLTVSVPAGASTIRTTATTSNGGPNLDYLDAQVAAAASGEYQAEDGTITQGVVESNHLGYTGTGFVNFDNVAGSALQWTVTVASAGRYNLVFRYANGTTTNRPLDVFANGVLVGNDVAFAGLGSWDTWREVTVAADLPAGSSTVRVVSVTADGGPNLDRLVVAARPANVVRVTSISALQSAANAATPGTRIELADGSYSVSTAIRLTKSGTASAPITIAAEHTGAAEIKGTAGFTFANVSYVTLEGFKLTHTGGITLPGDSDHLRFTRNLIQVPGTQIGAWVTVVCDDCQVDHNTFQNKSTEGVFLQITGPGSNDMAQRTWIHHNYFLNHTFSGSNGGESIRLGFSYRQLASAHAVVEYNLFEHADGDIEAISVKSSDNVIRYNTIRDSKGWIVLRHGNRNVVEGNVEFGSGIRLYENDHVIINNVVQGSQIIVGSGTMRDDTSGGTEHAAADRALVAFNTVVGSGTLLDIGPGSDAYGPDDCTFADNIFSGSGSGGLVNVNNGTNLHWQGNIIWAGTAGDMPSSGYRLVDPALAADAYGVYRLQSASSPAVDTALGAYSQVVLDVDLQTRTSAKDVGADEFVAAGTIRRPLTSADVGPFGG
jgi:Chondroitinase B/Carbohydrate binding module (family 6)